MRRWRGPAAMTAMAVGLITLSPVPAASNDSRTAGAEQAAVSAQARRGPTRLRVTPLPGRLERDCVPVFRERYIPQWGGWVLNAGESCRWVRVPY